MDKEQAKAILQIQTINKKKFYGLIVAIILCTIMTLSFFLTHFTQGKEEHIAYKENSDVDYIVYLKENDYFKENFLPKDNQYISSLIDRITANFKYNFEFDKTDINYQYSYEIVADVKVIDGRTKNDLYTYTESLATSKMFEKNNEPNYEIFEKIIVNYERYNEKITKFIDEYKLADATSTLEIKMNVNMRGNSIDYKDIDKETVMSLTIPLNQKTIAIETNYELEEKKDEFVINSGTTFISKMMLLALIFLVLDIVAIVSLAKTIIESRTPLDKFNIEFRKIISNYKSYIQKINNDINSKDYNIVNVDTFNEILEISEKIQQPILMYEDDRNVKVRFMIPSKEKLLYMYELKVTAK